jgi:hypothetical protein
MRIDPSNPEVLEIRRWAEAQLDAKRARLEADLNEKDTAEIRASIKLLKKLVSLTQTGDDTNE